MSLSPMMTQYLQIKDECKDSLLFFRLGDFYEMFYEDAVTASRELELTLTSRDCGMPERAPMCGVPYHALDTYLTKLIQKGYKVTICEQTTPPGKRGIIKREITRVVTPGTVTESSMLTEDKNNYIVSACFRQNGVGLAWADISTGEFNHTFIDGQISVRLNDLLARIEPVEIICNEEMLAESIQLSVVKFGTICPFTTYNETAYEYAHALQILQSRIPAENLSAIENEQCVCAAGALLEYIQDMQKCTMRNINTLLADDSDQYMLVDSNTRRTLELTQSLLNGEKRGSLYWCLNRTQTGMGARTLKKWIEKPEIDISRINLRLDFVEALIKNSVICSKLHELLSGVYDIERLSGKLSSQKILPVDFLALSNSLRQIPLIKNHLRSFDTALACSIETGLQDFSDISQTIDAAINDKNKPNSGEEGVANRKKDKKEESEKKNRWIFNKGYNAELDEYTDLIQNSKSVLSQLLAHEKEDTGIKNLKLGFNNVFGYFLEVPKSQIELVPYRYIRKQTVANAERYVTEELKTLEEKILNAEELATALEAELYNRFIAKLSEYITDFLTTAKYISQLDCLVSLAIVAKENGYVKPIVNSEKTIRIREGRHPVVEKLLKDEAFVPNDTLLDSDNNMIMLITGPNMAGKSIYMKQVALITVMAQIGSFIPASAGEIGVVDRIFTRVGASDDLLSGRSTFMVEMSEVTNILDNATDNSLILMDEIGRGTSTFDGLSIAQSIIEYLSKHLRAKVLFSTHYHELTDLENTLPGIKNYKLTVREFNQSIIFLRKLMRGSANRSFGIEVAGLAGLPEEIVHRAKNILKQLETSDLQRESLATGKQISLFTPDNKMFEIEKILRETDTDNITPRTALDILIDIKEKAEMQ